MTAVAKKTAPPPRPRLTFAHFPGRGPTGATCGDCAYVASWQAEKKDGQGHFVPDGPRDHWCGLCAKFGAANGTIRLRRDGKRPSGLNSLPLATAACKYWERKS